MFFVTGDLHGSIDINKLNKDNFPEQKYLTKNDYVIVTGDFGLIWNNSSAEKYYLDYLRKKPFTTLFVDGNHENFNLLNSYPVENWNGGNVHQINDSIIHLMRGQVFTIDSTKFFTFGGAESIDKNRRAVNLSWWPEELPNAKEYDEGLENLEKHNWTVDYIITHCCSKRTFDELNLYSIGLKPYYTQINDYFDIIEDKVNFNHWYFGHYHDNGDVNDKHTLLYEKVTKLCTL